MKNQKNIFLAFLKGIAAAVILTGIGIALLALFVKTIDLASPLISGAAIVIKAISVIVGTVLVCRSIRKKGAVCGGITALIYWGICFGLAALSGRGRFFYDIYGTGYGAYRFSRGVFGNYCSESVKVISV